MHVRAVNRIPLSSGLGSSAAAIVGGLVAANALVDGCLSRTAILQMACDMEGHADNAAAALFGGLAMVSSGAEELVTHSLSVAPLKVIIALPAVSLSTTAARAALPPEVPLKHAVFNIGHALLTAQALTSGDFDLLRRAMADRLHQPFRQPLIVGCEAAAAQARQAGAAAVTLSGAGPSLAAFAPPEGRHEAIAQAMKAAFEASGVACRTYILPVDRQGTKLKWKLVQPDQPEWPVTVPANTHLTGEE
jgi:homoserine kinase